MKKYLFIDRDGTLIEEPADFQIDSIEKFKLFPDVIPSLLTLQKAGYRLVMVTNQDGLGTPGYPQASFDLVQNLLMHILETQGIRFESVLICPHFEKDHCACRKPQLGLVRDYLLMTDLDRANSRVIGDRQTDVTLAKNMGIACIHFTKDTSWKKLTTELTTAPRLGKSVRKTNETEISVFVNLDGGFDQAPNIHTGIGFFDHMLEQISKHGGFALDLQVKGDIHVDEHHTIEDTALALGACLREALSDKVGIARYGFYLPMDDAASRTEIEFTSAGSTDERIGDASAALDLSGRAYFKFDGKFDREFVGGLATEMIPHFFKSLADGLQANLHLKIEGENTHHKVESAFKVVGRCLRMAIQKSKEGGIPSTKGSL
jgi:imidazoleglycerol-phosphate dehydratase/histidinol-phosphatase